jgi:hypothetical protein
MNKTFVLSTFLLGLTVSGGAQADDAKKIIDYKYASVSDVRGRSPLMLAVEDNDFNAAVDMIEDGVNIDAMDDSGNNAYCYAIANNNLDLALVLEKSGVKTEMSCYLDGVLFSTTALTPKPDPVKDLGYARGIEKITTVAEAASHTGAWVTLGSLAAVGALAAAGGGGGGGGEEASTESTPVDTSPYETTEFYGDVSGWIWSDGSEVLESDKSPFLDIINAQYAYARGYTGLDATTGDPVLIGVLDTGIDLDHSEFSGRVHSDLSNTNQQGIVDGAGDSADPTHQLLDDTHGTKVAGVIAANKEGDRVHGVAYDAEIIPYRMGVTGTGQIDGDRADDAIIDGISKGAMVFNLSYGSEASASSNASLATKNGLEWSYTGHHDGVNETNTAEMDAFIAAVTTGNNGRGAVIVKAAGNDGYSESGFGDALPIHYTEFDGYFINVVALSKDGTTIADWGLDLDGNPSGSNHCGVTKEYCISAPGSSLLVVEDYTVSAVGYAFTNGTSVAAPTVSGAAAIIAGAFPYMDAPEITSLMFSTADDLGTAGVDDVYGQGRLNLDAATTPGAQTTALTSSGEVISYKGTAITSSSVFAMPSIHNVAMTDELNRTFNIAGSAITEEAEDAFDFVERSSSFAKSKEIVSSDLGGGFATSFTMNNDESESNTFYNIEKMEFSSSYDDNLDIKFSYTEAPGADDISSVDSSFLLKDDATNHPFLSLASNGFSAGGEYSITDNLAFENNVFFGAFQNEDGDELGGMVVSSAKMNYDLEESSLSLELGVMNENSTMLGSSFEGAFALGENNSTYFAGLSGDVNLSNNFTAFANAYIGRTDVNTVKNSLIDSVDSIVSRSASGGVEYSFNDHKKAGLVLSQPLRVSSGSMDYGMATSRDNDGSYNFQSFNHDLSAGATEYNLQGYYKHQLFSETDLNIGAMYRMNADYVEGKSETAVMLKLGHKF